MPVLKAVPSLVEISCEKVLKWFLHVTQQYPGMKSRQCQREYIYQSLNPLMRQWLLSKAYSKNMYELNLDCKILLLELLGDKCTTCLDLTKTGYQYVEEVFSFYRAVTFSLVVNLKNLGIICNVKRRSDLTFVKEINGIFYRTMLQLKNLTMLTLSGLADAEMLTKIGKTCQQLEYLDISKSQLADDDAVAGLLVNKPESLSALWSGNIDSLITKKNGLCSSLKLFDISNTEVTSMVVCIILQLCPNIQSLGGFLNEGSLCQVISFLYENNATKTDSLIKFDIYNVHRNNLVQICNPSNVDSDDEDSETDIIELPRFLLLTHLYETNITSQYTKMITKLCPNLKALETSIVSLEQLQNFSQLTVLTVDCDFKNWVDELWYYLEMKGSKLISLTVTNCLSVGLPVNLLGDWCGNLKSLSLPVDCNTDENSPRTWKSLEVANILVENMKSLEHFCLSALNVCELYVTFIPLQYSIESLNDCTLSNILNLCKFSYLKVLVLGYCQLSVKGFNSIVLHCPCLEAIGYLDLWQQVNWEEIQDLKKFVKESNWNVKILLSGDFPGNKLHFTNIHN